MGSGDSKRLKAYALVTPSGYEPAQALVVATSEGSPVRMYQRHEHGENFVTKDLVMRLQARGMRLALYELDGRGMLLEEAKTFCVVWSRLLQDAGYGLLPSRTADRLAKRREVDEEAYQAYKHLDVSVVCAPDQDLGPACAALSKHRGVWIPLSAKEVREYDAQARTLGISFRACCGANLRCGTINRPDMGTLQSAMSLCEKCLSQTEALCMSVKLSGKEIEKLFPAIEKCQEEVRSAVMAVRAAILTICAAYV